MSRGVRERPILFSGPMVWAILDGRKTQTRRIVKHAHVITCDDRNGATDTPCPYGVPGDRLWVKETWAKSINNILYAADGVASEGPQGNTDDWDWDRNVPNRWKPSIHMSRASSRLTLEIVSVRVERLQDISEEDAIAEGVPDYRSHAPTVSRFDQSFQSLNRSTGGKVPACPAVAGFRMLWAKINGLESWNANPWVWVIEFKRVGGGA